MSIYYSTVYNLSDERMHVAALKTDDLLLPVDVTCTYSSPCPLLSSLASKYRRTVAPSMQHIVLYLRLRC